jgi:hypothetical protein
VIGGSLFCCGGIKTKKNSRITKPTNAFQNYFIKDLTIVLSYIIYPKEKVRINITRTLSVLETLLKADLLVKNIKQEAKTNKKILFLI